MKKIRQHIWLFAVMVIAIVLRFWQLGAVPVSPDWDEAALGYNAYSILKTGRDEYGVFLPRELRSFDDYKPPLYAYLTIPSVAAFGLNVWSVRLPSAIMGTLAVFGTYLLVLLLFKNSKLALLSTFLLAISPWHLQFSRIAFEANTGVTLNIWGILAFLYGLSSLQWFLTSAFLFGLSLYAYHSERVFVPLLVFVLVTLWRKEVFRDWKKVFLGIVIGLITIAPLLPIVMDKTAMTRLKGTSPLSDQTKLLMRTVGKLETHRTVGDRLGALLDNRRVVYALTLADGYISHFSLEWLFLTGDNDRHHAPDNGLLYLWELPFLLWGIINVWQKGGRIRTLLFAWMFLTPIAASPTGGTPHAIRTLVFLPVAQIFVAVAVWDFMLKYKKLAAVFACIAVFNILFYFHMYYRQMNREYSQNWQYGYKQAIEFTENHKTKYKKIVVSTALEQPHMFFLFYTKYDPVKYLAQGGTSSGGFREMKNHFDVYEFRPISDWNKELHDGTILYVGTPKEIATSGLKSINYLNGMEAIRISE